MKSFKQQISHSENTFYFEHETFGHLTAGYGPVVKHTLVIPDLLFLITPLSLESTSFVCSFQVSMRAESSYSQLSILQKC